MSQAQSYIASFAWVAYPRFGEKSTPEDTYCAWCGVKQSLLDNPTEHVERHAKYDEEIITLSRKQLIDEVRELLKPVPPGNMVAEGIDASDIVNEVIYDLQAKLKTLEENEPIQS